MGNESAIRLTIEKPSEINNTLSFETKKEAKKELRRLCKELDLTRQNGFWGNAQTGIEIYTTF